MESTKLGELIKNQTGRYGDEDESFAVLGPSTLYQPGRTGRSSAKYLGQTDSQSMEVGAEARGEKHLLMWVHRFCGWYFEMLSGACPAVMVAETSQSNVMRRRNLPCGLVQGSTYQE